MFPRRRYIVSRGCVQGALYIAIIPYLKLHRNDVSRSDEQGKFIKVFSSVTCNKIICSVNRNELCPETTYRDPAIRGVSPSDEPNIGPLAISETLRELDQKANATVLPSTRPNPGRRSLATSQGSEGAKT
ncbi:hypothetical protein EDD18DRAFT_1109646 [Armillaria luteobubalina]|uniref:Uncharacterized protein n=1 Tax=Armillaria luteobubalina TaxID=153913 RepID=A0AA39UN80_9AGAR|nr:hypothetical protein EDD18DRAFT_1109646 [Armillaria luteobubalina]